MAILVSWYSPEEAIMMFQFDQNWNLDDVYAALQAGDELETERTPQVIIYDMSRGVYIPPNFFAALGELRNHRTPDVKQRVFIAASQLFYHTFTLVERLYPDLVAGIQVVKDWEQAQELLQVTASNKPLTTP